MINYLKCTILIAGTLCFGAMNGMETLDDPYTIMEQHYTAIGGLDRLRAERGTHTDGEFVLVGTGLQGTLETWSEIPNRSRQELDLNVFTQTTGDNGEFSWVVDTNGKLKILRDEETAINRKLQQLLADYAHMDRSSKIISLSYEGIEEVDGKACYGVRITNSLDSSETVYYIDADTFLLNKSVDYATDGTETQTVYSDYREVGGILRSFHQRSESQPTGQVQEVSITQFEVNPDYESGLFDPPVEDADDFLFTNGTQSEDISIRFFENHLYIEVTVNNDKRLWIMDSGAGMTVIDREYANELGLIAEGNIKGHGVNNVVDISLVNVPGLAVQGIQIDEQKAAAIDLGQIFAQLSDMDVAGILGYDFFSRFVTKIDYANEKVSFYHPDNFEYVGPGVIVDAPLNGQNMFTIPMTVEGDLSGQWRFDTGASGSGFHYDFASKNGLLDRTGSERQSFGAGGSHVSRVVKFSGARIAGFELPPLLIAVPPEPGHGALAEKSLIGNLGSNVFQNFVVYMDYKRQQIILEKGDDFGKSDPYDNSGLQIWYPNGEQRVEIRFIADGSAGDKAGFQVDDRILAINDVPVELLDGLFAVRELLKADPGTTYSVSVQRGEQQLVIDLILDDLFKVN